MLIRCLWFIFFKPPGPYWCARGNLMYALNQCMETGDINVDYLAGFATSYALGFNSIDDPGNMANAKMYVFGGSRDSVVVQGICCENCPFIVIQFLFVIFVTKKSTFISSILRKVSGYTDYFLLFRIS